MIKKKLWKYFPVIPIAMFVGISFFFYNYATPEDIVTYIGVNNVYALMFILSLLGGLTAFSGIPYHILLITLAASGPNPFLLGLSTAAGVIVGDSTSYYIGYHGKTIAPDNAQKFFHKIYLFVNEHTKILPLFCLFYGSLVPFSNDFIVISAGLIRYPFWKVMIPLGIGNVIFNISLAYLSSGAYVYLRDLLI